MILSEIKIDFASPVPVYDQIKRKVKQAIARKSITENEPLPSIRELASFLKINPNTVARAFRELQQEGIIDGRAGKGFWVKKSKTMEKEKMELVRGELLKFIERAIEMGISQNDLKHMIAEFFERKP